MHNQTGYVHVGSLLDINKHLRSLPALTFPSPFIDFRFLFLVSQTAIRASRLETLDSPVFVIVIGVLDGRRVVREGDLFALAREKD